MTSREEFAEMLADARELRLLRAVAEAARALLDNYHYDAESGLAALGDALRALEGEQR